MVEIDKEFECSICLDVIDPPVATPCGHTFCEHCIKATMKKRVGFPFNLFTEPHTPRKNAKSCKCPECNQIFDPEELVDFLTHPLTRPQKNRLMATTVSCKNCEKGCEWEGKYEQRSSHMKKCGYNQFLCEHCDTKIFAKDKDRHSPQIQSQPWLTCFHQIVQCGNEGCDWSGKWKDHKNHDAGCPFKVVKCKWCNKDEQRRNIKDHEYRCPGKVDVCITDIETVRQGVACLERDINALNLFNSATVETMGPEFDKLQTEVEKLATENVHFHEMDKGRKAEIQNLEKEVDTLNVLVGSLRKDVIELRGENQLYDDVIQHLDHDVELLKTKNESLEDQLSQSRTDQEEYKKQISDLTKENQKLKMQIEKTDKEQKLSFDRIMDEIENLHKHNRSLRTDLDKYNIKRSREQLEMMKLTDVPDSDSSEC